MGRRLGGADITYKSDLPGFWHKLASEYSCLVKENEVEWLVSSGLEMAADVLISELGQRSVPSLDTPVLRRLTITTHDYK